MIITPDTVKNVIYTKLEDVHIQTLIEMATRQTNQLLDGKGLSDAVLSDIVTWLTAHYIAIGHERQTEEERVDDVWVVHQGQFGEGLHSTTYGQMVLTLDSTGSFAKAIKGKMRIKAIPQDPDSSTHDVV